MIPTQILIDGTYYELRAVPNKPKEIKPTEESKEWEIVKIDTSYWGYDSVVFSAGKDGTFRTGLNGQVFEHSQHYLLQNNGKIKSVRRLSDGEVFSVGDEVTYKPTQR